MIVSITIPGAPIAKGSLTGQRFGRLIALDKVDAPGVSKWFCKCDCGTRCVVRAANLKNGNTRSCGCLAAELRAAHTQGCTTHGKRRSREYGIWWSMRQRCGNPANKRFSDYGGRGISVCERWTTFVHFYADMGPRPSDRHSIDRIDNNGDYEPGNCRWATPKEQRANQRPKSVMAA